MSATQSCPRRCSIAIAKPVPVRFVPAPQPAVETSVTETQEPEPRHVLSRLEFGTAVASAARAEDGKETPLMQKVKEGAVVAKFKPVVHVLVEKPVQHVPSAWTSTTYRPRGRKR